MKTSTCKTLRRQTMLILLVLCVFTACAPLQQNSPKEVSILGSEIDQGVGLEVGDILEVVLPANPSTGYLWEVGFYNQSVLKPYGEPEFSSTNSNLGAEESQKLHMEAIGEGETELVLVYHRTFENEVTDLQTFMVNVTVK